MQRKSINTCRVPSIIEQSKLARRVELNFTTSISPISLRYGLETSLTRDAQPTTADVTISKLLKIDAHFTRVDTALLELQSFVQNPPSAKCLLVQFLMTCFTNATVFAVATSNFQRSCQEQRRSGKQENICSLIQRKI